MLICFEYFLLICKLDISILPLILQTRFKSFEHLESDPRLVISLTIEPRDNMMPKCDLANDGRDSRIMTMTRQQKVTLSAK